MCAECVGVSNLQGEKSSSQWEMHGANLEKQSASGAPWVGWRPPRVGAADKAEQRALEEGFGGQSRCGRRLGGEDVGTRKPVLAARACLRPLLRSAC